MNLIPADQTTNFDITSAGIQVAILFAIGLIVWIALFHKNKIHH